MECMDKEVTKSVGERTDESVLRGFIQVERKGNSRIAKRVYVKAVSQ